LSAYRINLY